DGRRCRTATSRERSSTAGRRRGERPENALRPPAATRLCTGATPMPEPTTAAANAPGLSEHPALRAWATLQAERPQPERVSVQVIRQKVKSAVYRLSSVAPGDGAVIAKRCPLATGLIEHEVYTKVLPHLPVTALRCYGLVREDGGTCWLFLEEAGGKEYSPQDVGQRLLAGRWLGLLHAAASNSAGPAARLPDRGPGRYLEHLRGAHVTPSYGT